MALRATLTKEELVTLPRQMVYIKPKIIQANPDRPNILLDIRKKDPTLDVVTTYEKLYQPIFDALLQDDEPEVTLVYMPLEYRSRAMQ